MNVLSKFAFAAMDFNGPPGLTHPLLVEKYAWVDQRLNELYHNYALTADNCDEYEAAGLLTENWAWVDDSLRKKYYSYALTSENCDEYEEAGLLCPAPLAWVDYRERDENCSLEEDTQESVLGKCSRSESDISDDEEEVTRVVKRLRCQSPLPSSKYLYVSYSKPMYSNICSIDYDYEKDSDSVSSLEAESDEDDECCKKCNASECLSEVSTLLDEDFNEHLDGYDSDDWYAHCARFE
jgi:hypothetical protein